MKCKLFFVPVIFISLFAQSQVRNERYAESNRGEARRFSGAQDEEDEDEEPPSWKSKLFAGGTISLGLGGSYTMLGGIPHFGYSITNFLDVALVLNFNYISQRDYLSYGDKLRQTVTGPGAFVRVFPLKFLFAQCQYEHSFLREKYIPAPSTGNSVSEIFHLGANSYLVGGGYAGGREGGNSFYYLSILWDIGEDRNSPYVDGLGRSLPIIRGGLNIALFQDKSKR